MTSRVQLRRTAVDNDPPTPGSLVPGELSIEMGTPVRLWVGVPSSVDTRSLKLLHDGGSSADKPYVDAQDSALQAQITAAQAQVTAMQAQVATLQAQVTAMQAQATAMQAQVDALSAVTVTQVKLQLIADGMLQRVSDSIPADVIDPINVRWFSSGSFAPNDPLYNFIQTTLSYTAGQMSALLTSAKARQR